MARGPNLDSFISAADRTLRALLAPPASGRPVPPTPVPAKQAETPLSTDEKRESAALMRVNHAGEVAAQALYHAQALFARDPGVREFMLHAAREETDHLAWCERRVRQLDSRTSLLAPLWYVGSFAIGAAAGLAGDRTSLGFIDETEKQVCAHLDSHLEALPPEDERSRRIVAQMKDDEDRHASDARASGAAILPRPIRELMRRTARIMTRTAYRI
jgi:ubiquinone biosynthesis monooxygenase Coq7